MQSSDARMRRWRGFELCSRLNVTASCRLRALNSAYVKVVWGGLTSSRAVSDDSGLEQRLTNARSFLSLGRCRASDRFFDGDRMSLNQPVFVAGIISDFPLGGWSGSPIRGSSGCRPQSHGRRLEGKLW